MTTFTVLGATGRTGRLVAHRLIARGCPVRVVLRERSQLRTWHARGAEVAIAHLEDEAALTASLRDTSALFAILPDDLAAADFVAHRRRMIASLAASVRAAGVSHVVFVSSLLAPLDAGLARELHAAERALAATGCTLTVLRCAYFHDNAVASLPAARERGIAVNLFASADTQVPMVALADVAAAAVDALERPRTETVDVIGASATPAQLAELLGGALGKPLALVTIPPAERVAALCEAGLPAVFAAQLAEMYAAYSAGPIALRGTRVFAGVTSLAASVSALVEGAARTTIAGVIDALTDAWNRHDLVAMGALYREDADFVNIFGGHLAGRDEIVREHVERHRVMFANARMTTDAPVVRAVSPVISLVRVAWTMRGIHTGPDRRGLMLHVLERGADGWTIVTTQNTELSQQAAPRFLDLAASG